ncbi:filamentous hemagglutinin N-terminal domain-containing protein [Roseateles sp. DAIF2]|uniref:MBG domain-containing protein n=1 Tax=Roseateles sp. DAIF2 TaxID=2714952 RepID=UPI0018A2610B|nr:MBG domain-containing protein [Roseateles sp. DAIF2]QPF73639.1 filamentous hemagglutinin N-terminal domain-containing protein [Roseateles sp. DAIF2]
MNKTYRLIWNELSQSWVPAPEGARARGQRAGGGLLRLAALSATTLLAAGATQAQSLPSGAQVVAGSGSIAQSGNQLTITQTSDKLATNWQSFSIGAGQSVNFVQPSSSAIALNRVLGSGVSTIQGALNANGQVFLLNPNGVLFSATAQVNVGGLVASTLNLGDADFMAGRYRFSGDSTASVVNAGRIQAAAGGHVALIAARISNTGSIATGDGGRVQLGAGRRVLLDLGGPARLEVEQGALDALIEQGGAIRADGGLIYLTAKSAGEIAGSVIKHTGTSEARTLASGAKGEIYLLGDLRRDGVQVGGTLDASAPQGGDGGFIETSAAKVNLAADRKISTLAARGKTGTWLIDPNDYTIAASGGDITGAQLSTDLASTNVTIATTNQGTAGGNGDIFVNDGIDWSSGNTLTLKAERDIQINRQIRHGAGTGDLILRSDSDANGTGVVKFADASTRYIDFSGSDGNIKLYYNPTNANPEKKYQTPTNFDRNIILGGGALAPYMLVNNASDLLRFLDSAGQFGDPSQFGFVALGQDISPDTGRLTIQKNAYIRGVFDGNGHKISNMDIKGGGLFYYAVGGVIKDLTIDETNTVELSFHKAGAFVGQAKNSTLENLVNKAPISVTAGNRGDSIGGIVGEFKDGTMINVINHGNIDAGNSLLGLGGIVGWMESSHLYRGRNHGHISGSTSSSTNNDHQAGGIAGTSIYSTIVDVKNTGNISIRVPIQSDTSRGNFVGGIIGDSFGDKIMSQLESRGSIAVTTHGRTSVGGLVGQLRGSGQIVARDLFFDGAINVTANKYTNGADANLYAGGIFGSISRSTTTNSKHQINNAIARFSYTLDGGSTIPSSFQYTAALIGSLYTYATVSDAYWLDSATGFTSADGAWAPGAFSFGTGSAKTNMAAKSTAELGTAATFGPSWEGWSITDGSLPALKPTVIAYADPIVKQYDGQTYSAQAAAAHIKYAGGSSADVSGNATIGGSFASAKAANDWSWYESTAYGTQVGGLSAASADKLLVQAGGLFKINQRLITVTADNLSYTYGGTDPALTWQITSGALAGSDAFTGGVTRNAGTNAGIYRISTSALSAGKNYLVARNDGTLTIAKAPLTITANNASKTYDGLRWSGGNGLIYSGFVNGETAANLGGTPSYGGSSRNAVNAGSYTLAPSGLSSGNYTITMVSGVLTITPRAITVTADHASKVYGDADPKLGWRVTAGNLVGNDRLSGALTRIAGDRVGSYKIDASALGNASGNYTITTVDGALTIAPRAITVTADSTSKAYGEADPTLDWRITSGSLVQGDSLSGNITRATGENAGRYTVSVADLANGNYAITAVDGALTINPRALTVTVDNASKIYGSADPALSWQLTGGSLAGSDKLSGSLTRAPGENVGRYAIDASALANGNYVVTVQEGNLTVNPRPITVTADSASKVYGDADPALGWRLTGGSLVGADTLGGGLTRAPGDKVGSYKIDASALVNGNYAISVVDGALTITPRAITVTAGNASKVQGQTDPALGWRVSSGSLIGDDRLEGQLTRAAGEDVGGYAISAAALANGNYLITVIDGMLSITAAPKPGPGTPPTPALETAQSSAARQAAASGGLQASSAASTPLSPRLQDNSSLNLVPISGDALSTALAASGSGRDAGGALRVLVVDGGLRLPVPPALSVGRAESDARAQ